MLTESTQLHFLPTWFYEVESLFLSPRQFLLDITKLSFFPPKFSMPPMLDTSTPSSWTNFWLPLPCPINPDYACHTSFHLLHSVFCIYIYLYIYGVYSIYTVLPVLHTAPRQKGFVSDSRVKKLISYECIFLTLNKQKMASSLVWLPDPQCKNNFPLKALWFFFFWNAKNTQVKYLKVRK